MKKSIDKSDLKLIKNIQKNVKVSDSLKELELKHSGICHQMIKKYQGAFTSIGIDPMDLNDEKKNIIYNSAIKFDPSKNIKFSTWVGNQMKYLCLNSLNRKDLAISMDNDKIKNIIEKRQAECNIKDFSDQIDYIFNILKELKDDRIIDIFKFRYFSEKKLMSWHKIAKKMNLSTQTIINLHNKNIKILCQKLNNKNSIDKI